jgi:hypothetical protein
MVKCKFDNCIKSASFELKFGDSPSYCMDHKDDIMIDTKHKRCLECDIMPSFGKEAGKATHCAEHKKDDMFDVVSRQCKFKNCPVQPSFGREMHKPTHCDEHKEDDMLNVVSKRCEFNGCTIIPVFGKIQGKATHCEAHKEDSMLNVISKRCIYEGCPIQPAFGKEFGKATHCEAHKDKDMFNVKSKLCMYEGCPIRPTFGKIQGKSTHCSEHKEDDMFDVINKRCEKCDKRPNFGFEKNKPTRCKTHKEKDMKDVVHKLCEHPNCTIRANYGSYFTGRYKCAKHYDKKTEWKINGCINCKNMAIWSQYGNLPYTHCDCCVPEGYKSAIAGKCNKCGLNDLLLDSVGNCLLSCSEIHKDRVKYSENEMLKKFTSLNWNFVNDKIAESGCSLRRPDFTFDFGSMILIVENDENQHKSRPCECEQIRMIQLFQDYGGIPVHFIRFNPDKYKCNKGTNETLPKRLDKLCKRIDKIKNDKTFYINNPNLTVSYMYYDNWDDLWSIDKFDF